MTFLKKSSMVRYYFFPSLDTLTFDQYMLFFSEFWYRFSYLALAWYSTLRNTNIEVCINVTELEQNRCNMQLKCLHVWCSYKHKHCLIGDYTD